MDAVCPHRETGEGEDTVPRAVIAFPGPGRIVVFDLDIPGIGKVTMFQTHTPVEAPGQRAACRRLAENRTGNACRQQPSGAGGDRTVVKMRRRLPRFRPAGPADGPVGRNAGGA